METSQNPISCPTKRHRRRRSNVSAAAKCNTITPEQCQIFLVPGSHSSKTRYRERKAKEKPATRCDTITNGHNAIFFSVHPLPTCARWLKYGCCCRQTAGPEPRGTNRGRGFHFQPNYCAQIEPANQFPPCSSHALNIIVNLRRHLSYQFVARCSSSCVAAAPTATNFPKSPFP